MQLRPASFSWVRNSSFRKGSDLGRAFKSMSFSRAAADLGFYFPEVFTAVEPSQLPSQFHYEHARGKSDCTS